MEQQRKNFLSVSKRKCYVIRAVSQVSIPGPFGPLVLEILIGLYEDKTLNNFGFKRSKIKVVGVTNAKIAFDSSDKCEQWGDMHFFLKSIF